MTRTYEETLLASDDLLRWHAFQCELSFKFIR